MKLALFIPLLSLAIACSTQSSNKLEGKQNAFYQCFSQVDTTAEQHVVGCSSGFFKRLDDQYVMRIVPRLNYDYYECKEVLIDTASEWTAELWIFEKGKASLTNRCSDLILMDEDGKRMGEPLKKLNQYQGKLFAGKTGPSLFFRSEMPELTIHIFELVFIDPETKEKITIRDELLWKVPYAGTPG